MLYILYFLITLAILILPAIIIRYVLMWLDNINEKAKWIFPLICLLLSIYFFALAPVDYREFFPGMGNGLCGVISGMICIISVVVCREMDKVRQKEKNEMNNDETK